MSRLRVFSMVAALLALALTANRAHAWCNPDPLTCDTVLTTNLHSGNTHDDVNRYPPCTGSTQWNGNSHVYRVYPSTNSPMWISLEWTAGATQYYDLQIFILTHCNRDSCIATDPHLVYLPSVVPGADYWIIIEGRGNSADAQTYTLSLYCDDNPLSAELISFDAERSDAGVELSWSVASETDNEYFSVERRSDDSDWSAIARVDGRGTEAGSAHYAFTDRAALSARSYEYRLWAVDFDGSRHELGTAQVNAISETILPGEFKLVGNYPNPFNPSTKIVFELSEVSDVRLDIFSVDGRRVSSLIAGSFGAGTHEIEFDASPFSAGVYLARLSNATRADMMKMILLK